MGLAVLQLCLLIGIQLTIVESSIFIITDGGSLKKFLCGNTLPPNTQLVLDTPKLELSLGGEGSEFCLLENTTNISITASKRVLEMGHWYVNVSCSDNVKETFGFGFFNVTDLTIMSVLFVNCMARITPEAVKYVNESSQFVFYANSLLVPLFFNHCNDLNLYNVFVDTHYTDEYSMGLVGVNLCGKSLITQSLAYSSEAASAIVNHSLPVVFLHYIDSNYSSTATECNLNLTGTISAHVSVSNYVDFFRVSQKSMPVLSNFGDLSLFMVQSFLVNVELNINGTGNENTVHIFVGYINSMKNSSFVTFQGLSYNYLCKMTQKISPIIFSAVFYETPMQSLKNSKKYINDVSNALLVKSTTFSNINYVPDDASGNRGMLHIMQYTRTLSYQVTLENISWCENLLPQEITTHSFSPLYVQDILLPEKSSHLHLTLKNLLMLHNLNIYKYFNISAKSSGCLMCFENIKDMIMTDSNYFAENYSGSVISITSSNLSISGRLTINDGYAIEGGGIRLNSMSTLFLNEPLEAKFINNIAKYGSAIYAPIRADGVSSIQIVPREEISLDNVSNIAITLHFSNNSNGHFASSFYAPQFSIFGRQLSPNLLFKGPKDDFSFEPDSWDSTNSQFAYTTLIDRILVMEESDKYRSLANGLCLWQNNWLSRHCNYIDQNIVNSSMNRPPLPFYPAADYLQINFNAYAGQNAFSLHYSDHQEYSACCDNMYAELLQNGNPSLLRDNSTLTFAIRGFESANCVISLSDAEINIDSVPILEIKVNSCPIGFIYDSKSCICELELKRHNYHCNIVIPSIISPNGYWTSLKSNYSDHREIDFSSHCPPYYCDTSSREIHLYQDSALSCLGNRKGDLCGECKDNHSMVFGSVACHDHCTNLYLLTIPVYALAGVLLVLLLFALRLTVATGTINGLIFYANVLALVMDRLTENISSPYVAFVRVWVSLLNLDLGFPLCF